MIATSHDFTKKNISQTAKFSQKGKKKKKSKKEAKCEKKKKIGAKWFIYIKGVFGAKGVLGERYCSCEFVLGGVEGKVGIMIDCSCKSCVDDRLLIGGWYTWVTSSLFSSM